MKIRKQETVKEVKCFRYWGVLQVEVSKYQRKKEKKKKRRDSTYDQAIKGTAREEAGVFYVRKGTGIL